MAVPDWVYAKDGSGRFQSFQQELWLAQGRLRTAVNWSDEMLPDDTAEQRPESEVALLTQARVLIVRGDGLSLDKGLGLLDSILQAAEAEGRSGIAIDALALQSLAHWKMGHQPTATGRPAASH